MIRAIVPTAILFLAVTLIVVASRQCSPDDGEDSSQRTRRVGGRIQAKLGSDPKDQQASAAPVLAEKSFAMAIDPTSKKATGLIHLMNPTTEDIKLRVSAGSFVSASTGQVLNGTAVFGEPGKPSTTASIYEADLKAGMMIPLTVTADNLWEAGECEAELLNNGRRFATIKAQQFRPPFGLKLVTADTENPQLAFFNCRKYQITLRNDDPMTYVVSAQLSIAGRVIQIGEDIVVPAGGDSTVSGMLPSSWFAWGTYFRSRQYDGALTLTFKPPTSTAVAGLPSKRLTFQAKLSSINPGLEEAFGYAFVIFFLVVGGGCSLVVSNLVPNLRSRTMREKQTDEIDKRTGSISNLVDSRLRAPLWIEGKRLRALLRSRAAFMPQLGDVFPVFDEQFAVLQQRVNLTKQLDASYRELRAIDSTDVIPTKLASILKLLDRAQQLLCESDPTNDQLKDVASQLTEARTLIAGSTAEDQEFVKRLLQRMSDMSQYLSQHSATPRWQAINQILSDPANDLPNLIPHFWNLNGANSAITPPLYAPIDVALSQLELLEKYVQHVDPDMQTVTPRQLEGLKDFLGYFRGSTAASLERASRRLDQIREGILTQDVIDAIENLNPTPKIELDQNQPTQFQISEYRIAFDDPQLDNAVARGAIECHWHFDHLDIQETGWAAHHYFPQARKYTVKAWFSSQGRELKDDQGNRVEVERSFGVRPQGTRNASDLFWVDAVQLIIALVIALIGLVSGALEQLAKLDIFAAAMAIFLLGFSADAIRHAIAPKHRPNEGPAPGPAPPPGGP